MIEDTPAMVSSPRGEIVAGELNSVLSKDPFCSSTSKSRRVNDVQEKGSPCGRQCDLTQGSAPLVRLTPQVCSLCEAEYGREAVEKAPSLRPDLIVLDLVMPVMNGLEAAQLLTKILPHVWLILLTSHDWPGLSRDARSAGIHAVVPKSEAGSHLIAQAEALFGMTPLSRGA